MLASAAALTAWILFNEEPAHHQNDVLNRQIADYFMEDFTTTLINREGQPRYRLMGTHMVHYPDNDTLKITAPHAVFYHQTVPRWDVVAEKALTDSTGEEIYLLGKVIIHQFGVNPKAVSMKIVTRNARVKPKAKFAETSQPVTILNSFGETHAVGARVYLREERIELLSQVRGVYEPPH